MKKTILGFIAVMISSALLAQTPQLMSYQAVVRNGSNQLLSNAPAGVRVSILQGSASGTAVYSETHTVTTNTQGLANLSIGGGTAQSGTFAGINWGTGPYFLKTETDPTGGTNYSITATSQLMSVPYALYSSVSAAAVNGVPIGGQLGEILTNCSGVPKWTFGGECPESIASLRCDSIINRGDLFNGLFAADVSSTITYSGGNGGLRAGRVIKSTGVSGLVAEITPGVFASGNGSLTISITGVPTGTGIASFDLNIAGKQCTLTRSVSELSYSVETVYCDGSQTGIIEVTNPITGKIWMDRNLGAAQRATSSNDGSAFGDLYQWGRRADGHQCGNSGTTFTLASSDQPLIGKFILSLNVSPYDWRRPQNDNLWQGVSGINNPCPKGYRLPTDAEWNAERVSWPSNNSAGAFASPLKLPLPGARNYYDGVYFNQSERGYYWSSTVSGTNSGVLFLTGTSTFVGEQIRAQGLSVRCIKD